MKRLIKLFTGTLLVAFVTSASAITFSVGDTYYLGAVDPGTPGDLDAEATFINYLATMSTGASIDNVNKANLTSTAGSTFSGQPNGEWDFDRSANVFASLPFADVTESLKEDSSATLIDLTGWTYLLGKYGQVSHVWVVAGLSGEHSLPANALGGGLSHSSVHAPGASVPDGGATAALLGLGVLGLAVFRRKS